MPDGLTLNKITAQRGISIGEATRRIADLGWTPSYVQEAMTFPTDYKIKKSPRDPMKQVLRSYFPMQEEKNNRVYGALDAALRGDMFRNVEPRWVEWMKLFLAIIPFPEISAKARSIVGRTAPKGSENDPGRSSFDHIIGRSPATMVMIGRASQLVARSVPVLIEGETGVGKELLARAIHNDAEDRRPFITFNCGAVTKELVATELFGHVSGAFTGALREGRPGRFELAHHGTLCLDEIGEMPLDLQPVLLRVLDEGVVYRVGDTQPRRVEVRLMAITNRDLEAEVAAGRFRRDLYYRISVTSITVDPLRDRVEDIEPLVDHFNRLLAARHEVPMRRFGPGVMAALRSLPWPGNVRELRNLIERLLLTGSSEVVTLDDLPCAVASPAAIPQQADAEPSSLDVAERDAIQRALHHEHGNLAAAARLLGVSRSTIYRKICRYRLEVAEAPKHELAGWIERRAH